MKKIDVFTFVGIVAFVSVVLGSFTFILMKAWNWFVPQVPLNFGEVLGITIGIIILVMIGAWAIRHFQEPYDGLPK